MKQQNTARSRESADHSALATSIILALSDGTTKSFTDLIHETGAGQSALAGALSELRSEHWIFSNSDGWFSLTARGLDLVAAGRRQNRRTSNKQRAASAARS
jgi:DNA-binding IclR family transcriptional regulator